MIDTANREQRFITTPDGKGWMFGFDEKETVTVHFQPEPGLKLGRDKCYSVSECEECEQ